MQPVDFSRNVVCIMGLPFDAIGMDEAVERVRAAARQRVPCFVSTPNLNFVVAARSDDAFRDSVLHSQLSLADGMPIVWAARLLGLPVRERVSGAGLFEALGRAARPALKVFFFGGADGVAQAACEQLNRQKGGIECVGFESPGFASVDAMSSDEHIERINLAAPDFVVVSLGAKKGQAWIERNRARLNAPVISHLGAVVNFAAGTVQRAPMWVQRLGLEWAWRIKEEPGLWKRYAGDAIALARMLAGGVIPLWWQRLRSRPDSGAAKATAGLELRDSTAVLTLTGRCVAVHADVLREAFAQAATAAVPRVRVDLAAVDQIDAAAIGLLLL
ncbi:MAG TPA: WecB/TagA/CpsF family glycosyltransferase, partial [Albitalea sp.]|nr:WecB/TagA/CpsF family glycosyltransferase [Albitalea sp.]